VGRVTDHLFTRAEAGTRTSTSVLLNRTDRGGAWQRRPILWVSCTRMSTPDRERGMLETLANRLLPAAAIALVIAALISPAAGDATTGTLRLHAVSGGRVNVLMRHAAPGRIEFVIDGRRLLLTRRPAVTVAIPRRLGRRETNARWRRLVARRAGSRRVLAQARFAMATSTSRRAPTLLLLEAPAASSTTPTARLRFSASTGTTSCSLDGSSFRRCSNPASFSKLSPGAHTVTIRAKNRYGRSSIRVRWTTTAVPADQPGGPLVGDPLLSAPFLPAAGRKLLFEDGFNGTTLNTGDWRPYDSAGHGGNGLRRPSALSLDGAGHLVITADMINGQIVSGGMSNSLNRTYGLYEFRVRTDPDPTAIMSGVVLTWPQSERWPEDGENDIYETGQAVNTRWPFFSFIHYTSSNKQYQFLHNADGAQWHTMAMDWTADAIKIYRDGVLVWTLEDKAAIPDVAHHLTIQLDAKATRTLTTPVRMYIDEVRIYQ
jgi:hypothetical protein